jgi:hypothetical protein
MNEERIQERLSMVIDQRITEYIESPQFVERVAKHIPLYKSTR